MLRDLCPDPSIRQQVRLMLDADSEPDPLLDHSLLPQPAQIDIGENIAGYKLSRELGVGGMGVVFEAEQIEPVRRTVALKVIKPGVDTRDVIERFNAERQALSMMNHPNIAKVLDAGSTELGRPFFVMELVDGEPITRYCERKQLSLQERLKLFLPVCYAIQHAHQKGIIHRDIKPSNVLVAEYDGGPVAKVIDFGVAKAINRPVNEITAFTRVGQIVGTFEYMSPEQSRVNSTDIDTRSDIYSLGVVLYELLTATPPFETDRLRSIGWEKMLEIIRNEDPPRPSVRLSTERPSNGPFSKTRLLAIPRRQGQELRAELDWIVLKAMEKDRNRRYTTPNDLANDIACYLRGDAVTACPPSVIYRFRKFARRNKVALATSALVCASLVLGIIGTTRQAIRASRAEMLADARADETREFSDYLKELLFGLVGSESELTDTDPKVWMVSFFKKAADDAEQRFAELPQISTELNSLFASTLSRLGEFGDASKLYLETLKSLEVERGSRDPDTIAVRALLVKSYINDGRWKDAREQCERGLKDGSELGEDHTLNLQLTSDLATLFREEGLHHKAVELHQKCLSIKRNSLGEDHYQTLLSKSSLAFVFESLKDFDEAETLYKQVLKAEETKSDLHNDHRMAVARSNLGKCYLKRARDMETAQRKEVQSELFGESADLLSASLDFYREKRGPYDSDRLDVEFHLAQTLNELGQYESATPLLIHVLEHMPSTSEETKLSAMNMLGWTFLRQSRFEEAEDILTQAFERLGDSPPELRIQVMGNLSIAYNLMGKLDESMSMDEQTSKLSLDLYGSDHPETLSANARLGLGYLEQGRTERGRAMLERIFNSVKELAGAQQIAAALAASYLASDEFEKAQSWTVKQSAAGP